MIGSTRHNCALRSFAEPLVGLLLMVGALTPLGCGGTSSLTGGSIPPGVTRSGDVAGTVVDSEAPDTPLESVEVRAVLPDGTTQTVTTDAQGAFAFADLPEGDIRLEVIPPPERPFHPQDVTVHITANEQTALAVPLRPAAGPAQPAITGTLTVTPQAVTVREGEFVDFHIVLRQAPPPDLRPLWIVEGNIGQINPRGRFHAMRAGQGRVIALLGDQRAVAQVRVEPAPHLGHSSGS